jgi:hypothetical protein
MAVDHAQKLDIVYEAPGTLQKTRILGPWNRLADAIFTHFLFLPIRLVPNIHDGAFEGLPFSGLPVNIGETIG